MRSIALVSLLIYKFYVPESLQFLSINTHYIRLLQIKNSTYFIYIIYLYLINDCRFILQHALKLSIVRDFFNKLVIRTLNKAANYDSEKKTKLQEKSKKLLHESITVSEYFNN